LVSISIIKNHLQSKKAFRGGMVSLGISCEPGIDEYDRSKIEYQPNKKMPFLSFYTTSYEFLEEVSKLESKITSIESLGGEIDVEIYKRYIEEKSNQNGN